MTVKPPAQLNQSIAEGLDCLLALATAGRPVGCSELAEQLGIEITRANRLLGTLAYMGYAERTTDRKYFPGAGIHAVAAMSLKGSRLFAVALPHIQLLIKETGRTVALGLRWRNQVCYLYHGGPDNTLANAIAGHELFPAEESSIGIVHLAGGDYTEVDSLFSHLSRKQKSKLLKEMDSVRDHGFCHAVGKSLAVGIGEPAIAGLAIAGPVGKRCFLAMLEALQNCANAIRDEYSGRSAEATTAADRAVNVAM